MVATQALPPGQSYFLQTTKAIQLRQAIFPKNIINSAQSKLRNTATDQPVSKREIIPYDRKS